MKKFRVLHISPTPLVDAPRKISEALNNYTEYESNYFIFNDYPGNLKGKFSSNTLMFESSTELILELIQKADIIHIHNFLTLEQENIIFHEADSNALYIYQVHSPLKEGPLFTTYAEEGLIKFDAKCVVAQYHPRLYPSYTIVPNIILYKSSIHLIKNDEIPKVLFSPAHVRSGGRWNDKMVKELEIVLLSLESLGLIDMTIATGISPYELYQLRKESHISIDEIVTGAYHQISLESMCSGNVVINNSDIFSDLMLQSIIKKETEIPFFKINKFNISERLLTLISDKNLIRKLQQESYDFYNEFLIPEKLIQHYVKLYKKVRKNV